MGVKQVYCPQAVICGYVIGQGMGVGNISLYILVKSEEPPDFSQKMSTPEESR